MKPFGNNHGEEKHGKRKKHTERSLAEISVTVWLTPSNASFYEKNGLLYLSHGEKDRRVTLCRQFPFDLLWEYISVMDEEECEIGMIRRTEDFDEEARQKIENELKKRYYSPIIEKIYSVKERYGFSYWRVRTEEGEVQFTLRDTFRSIFSVNGERVIFSDVDGNRFEVPSVSALDKSSRRKIELYL